MNWAKAASSVLLPLFVGTCGEASLSAQTLSFTPVGSIPGPVNELKVVGKYAYITAGATLTIVDVSNPAAPKREGAYTFPGKLWGFHVAGSLVYMAADFFGMGILDVSNAAAPTLRGSFKTRGQAKNVALVGTTALIADHMSGVDIVEVSNPAKPADRGSFFLEGYSKDVVAAGSIVYAVDTPTGLYLFEVTKPGVLDPVSVLQSATAPAQIRLADPPVVDGRTIAYVLGADALQMYDVSDPAAPVVAGTYRTPGSRPLSATVKGRRAYIADRAEGVQVVDVSTPATPRLVATYKTPKPARDVAVVDSLVFVAIGDLEQEPASREYKDTGEVLILQQTPP